MPRLTSHAFAGATVLLDGGMRDQLRLTWRLLRDERVSGLKYALPALVALYVASPVDPIPDFLLGIGQTDDIGIVVMAVMLLVRIIPWLAPADVVDEHARQMGRMSVPGSRSGHRQEQVVDASFHVRGEQKFPSGS